MKLCRQVGYIALRHKSRKNFYLFYSSSEHENIMQQKLWYHTILNTTHILLLVLLNSLFWLSTVTITCWSLCIFSANCLPGAQTLVKALTV